MSHYHFPAYFWEKCLILHTFRWVRTECGGGRSPLRSKYLGRKARWTATSSTRERQVLFRRTATSNGHFINKRTANIRNWDVSWYQKLYISKTWSIRSIRQKLVKNCCSFKKLVWRSVNTTKIRVSIFEINVMVIGKMWKLVGLLTLTFWSRRWSQKIFFWCHLVAKIENWNSLTRGF